VRNATRRDHLEPGTSRFRFGAEFRLNRTSSGSSADNGDNLIQRGLAGTPAQFKIQTDGRRAVCSVKGSRGRATVGVPVEIVPGDWYRAVCVRGGTSVRLRLLHWRDGAWQAHARHVTQATGELDFPRRTPLSVGGKLTPEGDLATSSDQFNGVVDNAFLDIG
jgi:hypothetical protein